MCWYVETFSFTVIALHVVLASSATKQALKTQLVTVQAVGFAYVGHGLISQLMLVLLATAILPMEMDASVPIQQQGVYASLDSTVLRDLMNQLHVWEVTFL